MNVIFRKILVPALFVGAALAQSVGIDAGRAVHLVQVIEGPQLPDSTKKNKPDTARLDSVKISIDVDTLDDEDWYDDEDKDTVKKISILDTLRIPDSLEFRDPFKFKYYKAIKDPGTRSRTRDSLKTCGDSLELFRLDSLYIKDSAEVAKWKFDSWYNSLSKKEKKGYLYEQKMAVKKRQSDSLSEVKDSIKAYKDSVIQATPRIQTSYVIPDSLKYKRLIMWTHDREFNNLHFEKQDTSFNYHFNDYPFYKTDVGATYLGPIGSPTETFNYFKREEEENAIFYTPYKMYSYSPSTLPMYNTKTPYTELAYWGTLFDMKDKEESEVKILTSQNILPELNLTLEYQRFGSNGMLQNEATDDRSCFVAGNYTGKRYLAHGGYIYHKVSRSENGGALDQEENGFNWIKDTLVAGKELKVRLSDADNLMKKHTFFYDQSYRIPMTFIRKITASKPSKAERLRADSIKVLSDSLLASGDSVAYERLTSIENLRADSLLAIKDSLGFIADSLEAAGQITSTFVGTSTEWSVFRKTYTDKISESDYTGREFYNNRFYIHPTTSSDSLRVMKFDNKLYIRLQPWTADAIVSKIDAGIGNKLVNYFYFNEKSYLGASNNTVWNTTYVYAGVQGQYKKYFLWDASGQYNFLGRESNDFYIKGNMKFNFYPFRRSKSSPLSLILSADISLKEPDFYQQNLYFNHFRWHNEFGKISRNAFKATLDIPHWQLKAEFGYALLANNIYYDTLGIVRQNTTPMSVLTGALEKNFKVGGFHFDNRILGQLSSNESVMPLPNLALNLRYYYQFVVQRDATKTHNVMVMQIGANIFYNTKWHAPSYNPELGVFYNQNEVLYGNSPYIDAFVNIQWKRACIFVKYLNANMGWPASYADYFSAHHYIKPQRAFKVGIFWPFYVQSAGNSHIDEHRQSTTKKKK